MYCSVTVIVLPVGATGRSDAHVRGILHLNTPPGGSGGIAGGA